jgi:hypothetical protein
MNQQQFEAKPEWKATIRRAGELFFIMEGLGVFRSNCYEYPEGYYPMRQIVPSGRQVDIRRLRAQLEAGQIELVSGSLPLALL